MAGQGVVTGAQTTLQGQQATAAMRRQAQLPQLPALYLVRKPERITGSPYPLSRLWKPPQNIRPEAMPGLSSLY
jgi:hypothetical protein